MSYTVNDIEEYIALINGLRGSDREIVLPPESITPDTADKLGEVLKNVYEDLRKRNEAEFEEQMKQQRYERGYTDVDVWNMCGWFIETVRPMLIQLRETRHGSPITTEGKDVHEAWDDILDRMIFLLGEMDEKTCTRQNPYHDAVDEAYDVIGEKISKTGEFHTISEYPEYKDLWKRYEAEERVLEKYRNECKDEFFRLFSEYFWALWD